MLTGGTAVLLHTQVALGCFQDRQRSLVYQLTLLLVEHFYDPDVFIRATLSAGRAADTGLVVDIDHSGFLIACDGSGGTTDHADRIQTMHTGMGDHMMSNDGSLP